MKFFRLRHLCHVLIGLGMLCVLLGAARTAGAQSPDGGTDSPQATEENAAALLTSSFSYQGQLRTGGNAVNGPCEIVFRLYSAATNGVLIGGPLTTIVPVQNGIFTANLNFGAGAFNGNDRWLSMQVRCPSGSGAFTQLSPRQQIMPVPYARFAAAPWATSGSNLTYSAGKVGIGTTTPAHQLSILGGPAWTANYWAGALELSNAAAIGWQANTGGQRFGIGQTNGGLYFFRTASDPGTTASPANYDMVITDQGRIGLGTVTPQDDVDIVVDTSSYRGLTVRKPEGAYLLAVNQQGVAITPYVHGAGTGHVCYRDGYITYCGSAAEYVATIDGGAGVPATADLVSIVPALQNPYDDAHAPFVVAKSATPCDANLIGYITDPEQGADGEKKNDHYLPLAIYGYFPANVTLENGPIQRGDALTSSSKPGYAMRATQACKIIGYALEDARQEGTIQVFANHGDYAAPEIAALRAQLQALTDQNAALAARLSALEQAVSGQSPAPAGP